MFGSPMQGLNYMHFLTGKMVNPFNSLHFQTFICLPPILHPQVSSSLSHHKDIEALNCHYSYRTLDFVSHSTSPLNDNASVEDGGPSLVGLQLTSHATFGIVGPIVRGGLVF